VWNQKPLKNIRPKNSQPYDAIASFSIFHFLSEEGVITPIYYFLKQ